MGTTDTDSSDGAATRLRHLQQYFHEHPVTGASGHSYISSEPRATAVSPGLPYNATVVEHIQSSVDEVVAHTREANPQAGPRPNRVEAIYDWAREHTEHAPQDVQDRRDALEFRHHLEHALAAGDGTVIRRLRCPGCGAPGLFWQEQVGKALCVNRHCAKRNGGIHRMYSVGQLAREQIRIRKNLRQSHAT